MSISKFVRSLACAWRGLVRVAEEEQSFRLQLAAAVAVLVLAFALGLGSVEKAILTLAAASVLVLELINSVFERLTDLLKPRVHHYVEDAKDIVAGSVLLASIASVVVGLVIFWPYVNSLMRF